MSERKVYQQLDNLIKNEGGGDGIVELLGDGKKTVVLSQGKNGTIVVSGGGEENIVLPNGEQIFVRSN